MGSPFPKLDEDEMAEEMSAMFAAMVGGFKAAMSKVREDPDLCDIVAETSMKMKKAYLKAGFTNEEAMFLLARISDSMQFNSSKKS